jgi:hypothetical protein
MALHSPRDQAAAMKIARIAAVKNCSLVKTKLGEIAACREANTEALRTWWNENAPRHIGAFSVVTNVGANSPADYL